jgi:hypothetical protein
VLILSNAAHARLIFNANPGKESNHQASPGAVTGASSDRVEAD